MTMKYMTTLVVAGTLVVLGGSAGQTAEPVETSTTTTTSPTTTTSTTLAPVEEPVIEQVVEPGYGDVSPDSDLSAAFDLDQATVELAWLTLSASEQSEVCETFWVTADSAIIDYLISPPDAMTLPQAEAFVELLWERC